MPNFNNNDKVHRWRTEWPRSLRRGSAVARLLGLRVRIPSGAWLSVFCERCVSLGRGLCAGLITRPEDYKRAWREYLSVIAKPRRPWPVEAVRT